MDSQKRDESRDRRREEALARRMGDALDRLDHRGTGECPDAELIAAVPRKVAPAGRNCAVGRSLRDLWALQKNFGRARGNCRRGSGRKRGRTSGRTGRSLAPDREPRARIGWPGARAGWPRHWAWLRVLAVWVAMRPPWRTADQSPSGILIAQAPQE